MRSRFFVFKQQEDINPNIFEGIKKSLLRTREWKRTTKMDRLDYERRLSRIPIICRRLLWKSIKRGKCVDSFEDWLPSETRGRTHIMRLY